jgi:hypothetical protein
MRDKLTQLIMECSTYTPNYEEQARLHAEYLAQHLLAEGVIVPLVKMGQKVYIIGWCGDIEEYTVRGVHLNTDEKGNCSYMFRAVIGEKIDIYFYTHYIGANVFLTREEAEKALERSENGKS